MRVVERRHAPKSALTFRFFRVVVRAGDVSPRAHTRVCARTCCSACAHACVRTAARADALFSYGRRSAAQRREICRSVAAFEFFLHQDLSYCYLFTPELVLLPFHPRASILPHLASVEPR